MGMEKRFRHFFIYYLPPILWMALIFKLSSGTVPSTSSVYWQDFVAKKTAHFLFFGFLAVLIYRALRGSGVNAKKALIYAIIFATFYGATDEFHQSFTQGREARLRDIGFDGLGSIIITSLVHKVLEGNKKWQKILL